MRSVAEEGVEILTPEHVPIRLVPAGLAARFLAVLLDFLIVMTVILAMSVGFRLLAGEGFGMALATAAAFVLQWGYHVFFEVRRQGRTPGKRLCGLRVVDRRGLPVSFQQSFVRNVLRALDFGPIFYGVGGLVALLDRDRRRLGDQVADTLVIRERPEADATRWMTDERRFNSLKSPRVIRRVRHRVGLEEREFLLSLCLRAEGLDPKARFDLMEDVGKRYRELLELDDPHLTGENVVRGLLAILYTPRS